MSNERQLLTYAAIGVVAIAATWFGIVLAGAIASALGAAIVQSIFGFIMIAGQIFVVLIVVVAVAGIPALVAAGVAMGSMQMTRTVVKQVRDLKKEFAAELGSATESLAKSGALDGGFWAAMALTAAFIFFLGTGDFFDGHMPPVVKPLIIAAFGCAIGKCLLKIPNRFWQVVGGAITMIAVGAIVCFLLDRYHVVTPGGLSWTYLAAAVQRAEMLTWFVIFVTIAFAIIVVLYPFTPSRWHKMWKGE
jgi:hypothetical protein